MYRQPNGERLTATQREMLGRVVALLTQNQFDRNRIRAQLPSLIEAMNAVCETTDDQQRMSEELDGWVRWRRLPGYWLAFLFQLAMHQRGAPHFIVACQLYAEAQINLNEDLALSSLENGYTALLQFRAQTGTEALATITDGFLRRMRQIFGYNRQWYAATSYATVNQLSEHPYALKTWNDLTSVFPLLGGAPSAAAADAYVAVIAACDAPTELYCRVLARRFLGSRLQGDGDPRAAAEQFALALADATGAGLDTEIGHLLRLHGFALMHSDRFDEAEAAFRRAMEHEAHPAFSYWRALSARELGDCLLRKMPREIDPAHPPEALPAALQAYREGRSLFEAHVAAGVVPVARAVEQQMFRSYADNAVQVAMLSNPLEMLAEIEAAGPRYVTDVIAEGRAAIAEGVETSATFRRARAVFAQDLTLFAARSDVESDFEIYVKAVETHRSERQRYLQRRVALTRPITQAQFSETIARDVLALRLPDVIFLIFHLSVAQTTFIVVDAASGQAATAVGSWTEQERRACHDVYRKAMAAATKAVPRRCAALMAQALDGVLEAYQRGLGPVLEMLLPYLKGKRLKIVPRFEMHEIPLHALMVGGKRLAEQCDVSYVPTLGAFRQIHRQSIDPPLGPLSVVHDAKGTFAYAGTLRQMAAEGATTMTVLTNASWSDFTTSVADAPPGDVLFACHGRYDPDDPRASALRLSEGQSVPFSTIFAELDLSRCRSVTLGACESGLGRTLVSAEYIGLPLALLSAGVRYVVGGLWQVNQIASAVLLGHHFRIVRDEEHSVPSALAEAQRITMRMTQDDVIAWLTAYLPEYAEAWTPLIREMDDPPFGHPLFWAGFYAAGDI